ncbi:hypothetical protein IHE56_21830 [Streptomyces sp. ID01-12c]|uniref:Uncharacterized protein n=1 Tax=Streptomyces caniscabiei TaxID=2746961 RepID=A0A927QKD0_9ACTN|nr:DUF6292 family protein [Streptomyces caniscabiei]MBD9704658.1 hypothetical protein [Streptomyces caniscabiei]MBD9729386.1 hypothetical protein [Streptomyces caniscabiei]MDX3515052.1 DUF6292 family protein [Streptomyces caniscabiei]MDX3724328.1 DUF6292 family protein [Streptomyces caniscabiei]MDX3733753.1 DUF6292 family protein [Streptomyces caniscabiei]
MAARAGIRAAAVLRGRQARPYLAEVTRALHALHARGWTTTDIPPAVQHPEDDEGVAALVLDGPDAPGAALVWSERHGWRTAPHRPAATRSAGAQPGPRPALACATSRPAPPPIPPTS